MKCIPMPKLTKAQKERFWSRVNQKGPNECWIWVKGSNSQGYGEFCPRILIIDPIV